MTTTIRGTVVTGFESVAKKEVESRLKRSCEKYRGHILFSIEEERLQEIYTLRSVDNLFAVLYDYTVEGLDILGKEEALDVIRDQVLKINWDNAVRWYQLAFKHKIIGGSERIKTYMKEYVENSILHSITDESPLFRVTGHRSGNKELHSFTSMDAARIFGSQLNNIFGWKADMKKYDIEILLNITKDNMLVMIALNKDSLFKRNVVSFGPTTLRATICYCLVSLADPKPGDVILDPLCGGGSIPIEGAIAFPESHFIGGDNHSLAIERCHENMEHNKHSLPRGNIEFLSVDSTVLPFQDNYISTIVTDMPFGKKIGSISDNRLTYPKILKEWERVITVKGKAIILTKDRRTIETVLASKSTAWKLEKSYNVNIGGLLIFCGVLINNK